jgi:hypothetical protein
MRLAKFAAIVLITNLMTPIASPFDGFGVGDLQSESIFTLGECQTESDLDCIQSVELRTKQNNYANAPFVSREYKGYSTDYEGNTVHEGETTWRGPNFTITLNTSLESLEHIILRENGVVKSRGSALRMSVTVSDPRNTFLRIKLRTSFLKPMNAQLKLKDASYEYRKISGGNLWTIEGSGLPFLDYSDWRNTPEQSSYSAPGDVDGTFFTVFVHHSDSRQGYGYWVSPCGNKGFSVQSNNTNSTGDPVWNSEDLSLDFSIYAPHMNTNGELNKGYFKYWASDNFLNCQFPGNNLTSSSQLRIQILDENGKSDPAVTQITHSKGMVYIFAAGFHFSKPTIKISAKKITINCQKKNIIRKVSGYNPKCPSGYSKK